MVVATSMCVPVHSSNVLTSSDKFASSTFFFNDTATTEIYTLSLHDALPILEGAVGPIRLAGVHLRDLVTVGEVRSEEHTSELQSPDHLVCRLLLEKKKQPTQPVC